jgi:hypothetical protein
MNKWQMLKFAALIFGGSALTMAGTICPAGNGVNPFTHNPDNAATGCNVVITIPASGSITVVVNDSTPYEASEDVLVGVVNNSASAVGSVNITSTTGVFGFDGDGICTFTFVGSAYCNTGHGSDPQDYEGPTSTFSNITGGGNNGTVNFSPAIPASGGTTYFSLEGIPTASLGVTGGGPGGGPAATPAPSSILLMLTALAGVGLFSLSRRFASSNVR